MMVETLRRHLDAAIARIAARAIANITHMISVPSSVSISPVQYT
jgi:hypothetical protein